MTIRRIMPDHELPSAAPVNVLMSVELPPPRLPSIETLSPGAIVASIA